MATVLAANTTHSLSNDVIGFGQTFTASVSGSATTFSLPVAARESGSGMLVTVSTFDGVSNPASSILGQVTIPETSLTESLAWVTATFDSPIALTGGATYFVRVLQFQTGRDGYNLYAYSNGNPYAGGSQARYSTSWSYTLTTDFAFELAGTVPEPSASVILAAGLAISLLRRRR